MTHKMLGGLIKAIFVRSHKKEMFALVAALVVSVFSLVLTISIGVRGSPWNPLGEYPTQQVKNRSVTPSTYPAGSSINLSTAANGPNLYVNQDVEVEGTKCNASSEVVEIVGTTQWVAIEPPGSIFVTGSGSSHRDPGCTTRNYKNPVPTVVKDRVNQLHEQGIDESIWQITGVETPVRDDGDDGVKRVWQTDNFTLIYAP